MKNAVPYILAALLLVSGAASCSRFGRSSAQSTEFATFIKAHTGGIISDKATIKVELASSIPDVEPGSDLKEGVLSFTPSMKGSARWLTRSMIEFIPEDGQLKAGQAYTAKLRLDRIQDVGSRRFRKYSFKFLVAIKEAILQPDGISISEDSPQSATAFGTVSLTEELPLEKVRDMIVAEYGGSRPEVSVTTEGDPLHYRFEVLGLERGDKDRKLSIRLKSGDTGFVADSRFETVIPAIGDFKVVSAEYVEADDPYILVSFSEPLSQMAAEEGMFTVEGAGRIHTKVDDSNVRIYLEDIRDHAPVLTVSDGVRSYSSDRLKEAYSKTFDIQEGMPAVEIPISGNILPDSRQLILPFRAVNLKSVDIRVIQIYEENVLMFLQDNDLGGSSSLRRAGRLVCKRCLRLDSDPSKNLHKWQNFSVDLSGLFKQEPGAIYRVQISFKESYSIYGQKNNFRSGKPSDALLDIASEDITPEDDMEWDKPYPYYYDNYFDWEKFKWEDRENPLKPSYYMDESRFPVINLLTSNLGVIAKYAGGDKLWVSVSDILTANPVFNAELYVYSYQLKEIGYAKTGTDGMAEVALSGKPFAVVTKRGGSTSYLKVSEGEENSLSRFDVGGKALDKGLKAFVYGERGVWRPGDTLHVTMILEDKEDLIPDSHPVAMEMYTPNGQFYTKLINSNARDGFYTFDIPTAGSDPTGIWNAYFKVGGATFHKALRIESVKPNRLKINLNIGEETIEGGQQCDLEIGSSWLTGPPAANLRTSVRMTLRKGASTFKGFEGYSFQSPLSDYSASEHQLADVRLDERGEAKLSVNMPAAPDAPGMLSADIVTTVTEEGGDMSFSTVSAPYSPFASYVGISLPGDKGKSFVETDRDYNFKVATVDKDGKRISGVNLEYSIYKLKWSWWWESRAEELDSYVNGSSAEPVATGTMVSGKGDCSVPFRVDYPEWGNYLVIVRDKDSGHVCGQVVYADWPSSRGRAAKNDPDALTMLSFSTDKETYDVGETVTVHIPSATRAQALVSIENSRTVISREWVKLNGEEEAYTFKVTPEMAPNFFIHITMVQPHERVGNDLPIRLYGVRPVMVNDSESHLEPMIIMDDELRPEEAFTVKIREKKGRPMTYTLAIVDEGLLDLTSFKTPDPWKAMNEREALGVKTWDLYDDVIGAYCGRFSPMFSIGGDETLAMNSRKDNRFNPIVRFAGPFTLTSGTASHRFRLPMYVGSVRVMVVAAREASYGNAEKTVPVKSPLMVLPTLPRKISDGEKVTMPVNVFALEDGLKEATVRIKAEGPVAIAGQSESQVRFEKQGDKVVKFALEATGVGKAKISVMAEGNGRKASQEISIEVKEQNPATLHVTEAVIAKGDRKHFGFTPFTSGGDNSAELTLTGYPFFDANGIYSFMTAYPYECTEQLAARGIALLSIVNMISIDRNEAVERMIPSLLSQIYQRQRSDGGFAAWPENPDSQSWISSMAGHFMILAQQSGYTVSKGVLASWSRYQKNGVQNYRNTDSKHLWDLEQAYRLFTLTLNNDSQNGAMNRLKESQSLSSQACHMLASAYSLAGKKAVAEDMLASAGHSTGTYQEKEPTFASPLRDKALAMYAKLLADDLGGALELSHDISKAISSGFYSTQEAAFCSLAMKELAERSGDGILTANVTAGTTVTPVQSMKATANIPVETETGGVDVENTSEGVIYAQLSVSRVPESGKKVEARSNGLGLKVSYCGMDGKTLNPSSLVQGTEFTAIITVTNHNSVRDCDNVALTQAIPSGWEIINDRIFFGETGSNSGVDIRDDRIIWHFDLPKGSSKSFKVRLNAAYEGEFVLPVVKCEAMYDPHISANTASGKATVLPARQQ